MYRICAIANKVQNRLVIFTKPSWKSARDTGASIYEELPKPPPWHRRPFTDHTVRGDALLPIVDRAVQNHREHATRAEHPQSEARKLVKVHRLGLRPLVRARVVVGRAREDEPHRTIGHVAEALLPGSEADVDHTLTAFARSISLPASRSSTVALLSMHFATVSTNTRATANARSSRTAATFMRDTVPVAMPR